MNEAVIVSAVRTAVGKAPNGALRGTRPDELAAAARSSGRVWRRLPFGALPTGVRTAATMTASGMAWLFRKGRKGQLRRSAMTSATSLTWPSNT